MKKLNFYFVVIVLTILMSCEGVNLSSQNSAPNCIWTERTFFTFATVQLSFPPGINSLHNIQTGGGQPETDLTQLLLRPGNGGIPGHQSQATLNLTGDGLDCKGTEATTYLANSPDVSNTAVWVNLPSNGGVKSFSINIKSDDYINEVGNALYYFIQWKGGSQSMVAQPLVDLGEKIIYTIDGSGRQIYMPDGSNGSNYLISDGEETDILP